MTYGEIVLRRSLRLLLNGYYSSDGVPAVSYRETRVRYKRKRRNRRRVNMETTEYPVEDSFDCCQDDDVIFIGNQRNYSVRRFRWIILLPLLCGCVCLFSTINSQQSKALFTTTNLVLSPGCNDQETFTKELHEEVMKLKRRMDYLLPAADMLPNFALESQGARILPEMTSETYHSKHPCSWFGSLIKSPPPGPKVAIQGGSHMLPGRCWSFAGSKGRLSIALSHKVSISHVSLGHIPKMLSPWGSISSAPKEFSIYGKNDLQDKETLLGTFLYDQDGDRLQMFKLPDHKRCSFSYITLQVDSNWGHPEYTCLYGFRVHGKLAG